MCQLRETWQLVRIDKMVRVYEMCESLGMAGQELGLGNGHVAFDFEPLEKGEAQVHDRSECLVQPVWQTEHG